MALTEYFLGDSDAQHDSSNKSKPYEKHINAKNPLGMGGAIARAYGDLLVDLWGGKMSAVAPRNFKVSRACGTLPRTWVGGGGKGRYMYGGIFKRNCSSGECFEVALHITCGTPSYGRECFGLALFPLSCTCNFC